MGISKRIYKHHYKGEQIGDLTLIERMPGGQKWKCVCKCGEIVITQASNGAKSCRKCAYARIGKERMIHGESPDLDKSATRLYRIWTDLRNRCNNPNNKSYKYYGGRGISVCSEWDDYITFKLWALRNGYNDSLTIDRIDNNGDYSPLNCRWVTRYEQMRNTRSNVLITIDNKTKTIMEWCRELGIAKGNMYVKCKKLKIPVEFVIKYCYENRPHSIPYVALSREWHSRNKEAS